MRHTDPGAAASTAGKPLGWRTRLEAAALASVVAWLALVVGLIVATR